METVRAGVSPSEEGFREGLAEQQVELGGVLQAGLPLVEAVSHDPIKRLREVIGISLPAYSHTITHAHTQCIFCLFFAEHTCATYLLSLLSVGSVLLGP